MGCFDIVAISLSNAPIPNIPMFVTLDVFVEDYAIDSLNVSGP